MGEVKSKRARVTEQPAEQLSFDVAPPAADVDHHPTTKKMKKPSSRADASAAAAPDDVPLTKEAKQVGNEEIAESDVPALSHKEARLAKRRKLSGLEPTTATGVPLQQSSIHPSRVISLAGNTIQGAPGVIVGNTPGEPLSTLPFFFFSSLPI